MNESELDTNHDEPPVFTWCYPVLKASSLQQNNWMSIERKMTVVMTKSTRMIATRFAKLIYVPPTVGLAWKCCDASPGISKFRTSS